MKKIYLDRGWSFNNGIKEKIVDLPHTNVEIPFNYFDEKIYQFESIYEKDIVVDDPTKDIYLVFDGVAQRTKLYLNDQFVLQHNCGYDMFKVKINDYLDNNKLHIKVLVDASENINQPPFGMVVDYLTYGGIYRDVYLEVYNKKHIVDVFYYLSKDNDYFINLDISFTSSANYEIYLDNLLLKHGYGNDVKDKIKLDNVRLWDIDDPYLYNLKVVLKDDNGEVIDDKTIKAGLRTVKFLNDGFYLNDKKIKIVGLNRHQSYPYVGYAMPRSMQEEDVRILKQELCVNAVRTSHYMQSPYFYDKCDELGLLVFTESPGWQFVGDSKWCEQAYENVKQMVLQNRNHPSIILWGVRINESVDKHDLYVKTNDVAHKLDPSRQTGGVRCYTKGEELEDVYTYNDFMMPNERALVNKDKVCSKNIPYLVSEFNGHMFPTKPYDHEKIKEEHMLRYAHVFDTYFGDDEITALFGWCMFDYNTHKEFGTGDMICYHGVLDMYRNMKLAGKLYQTMLSKEDTLYVSKQLKRGDYPASNIDKLYCLTNADEIKFYHNEDLIRVYTHKDSPYKNMKYGPILMDDFIGNMLVDKEGFSKSESDKMKDVLWATLKYGEKMPLKYKLEYLNLMMFHHITYEKGYELYGKYIGNWGSKYSYYKIESYKDNKKIKEIILSESTKVALDIKVSNNTLVNDHTYDVASIRIRAIDNNANPLEYYNEGLELKAEGPIEIIGPKILTLRGGMGGTYIRSKNEDGVATLYISGNGLNEEIKFNVVGSKDE